MCLKFGECGFAKPEIAAKEHFGEPISQNACFHIMSVSILIHPKSTKCNNVLFESFGDNVAKIEMKLFNSGSSRD
jgi:hypothetical protein